jgi:hypothetical protein
MPSNKYLGGSDSDSDYSVDVDEIDIHEIVRTGTLQELKEAIAQDRPKLIAAKDEVRIPCSVLCVTVFMC